ncbi:Gfo/Idh/MocA family protein [Bacillus sp. FJAT-28004]|uniref:Gfo/Idh/MocA family protein n=1 Tax=Bacillus sp. FJAT-28004 TaxID=1679165 RepID=UPI0006B4E0D3|nr:Gfo/Idh/MocA family oxidoreductase [Bacillus sp. FJAT-28004]
MENRPLRVFCIGLQEHWLSHWVSRPDVQIVGAADIYHEVDSPFAYLPQFEDIPNALKLLRPDLVTMVTPPNQKTCLDTIKMVLDSGYDVFLEKFRPRSWEDGSILSSLCRSTGRQVAIGESYRFDQIVERAKKEINSGRLGKLGLIEWSCRRPNIEAPWMNDYEHVMLEDLTYHHLGVIHYLIGAECFNQVYATSVLPAWSKEKSPSVVCLITQSNEGLQLYYYASWAAHGAVTSWLGDFKIDGSEGTLQLRDGTLRFINKEGEEEILSPCDSYGYELRAAVVNEYIEALQNGRKSSLNILAFQPVIRMIQAALESVKTGKPVDI